MDPCGDGAASGGAVIDVRTMQYGIYYMVWYIDSIDDIVKNG